MGLSGSCPSKSGLMNKHTVKHTMIVKLKHIVNQAENPLTIRR